MKYLLSFIFMLCASAFTAQAQSEVPAKVPAQNKPATETKAKTPAPTKPAMKTPKTAKDLDAFFKEGERQAKDGPHCEKPPAPVA